MDDSGYSYNAKVLAALQVFFESSSGACHPRNPKQLIIQQLQENLKSITYLRESPSSPKEDWNYH